MSKRSRSQEETLDHTEFPAKKQATATKDSPSADAPKQKLLCPYPDCNKTFEKPCRLVEHERSHTGERPFKCTYEGCDKAYRVEKHLAQHVNDTHTDIRKFRCEEDDCGASFTTSTRLKRHVTTVHNKDHGLRCTGYAGCNASFRKKPAFERHIRKDHLGLPPYLCPEPHCGMSYESSGALRNHKNREHGEMRYWCEVCGQDGTGPRVGFTIQSQLHHHMRKEHLNCMFCDFTSSSKHDLARHVDMQHTSQSEVNEEPKEPISCEWEGCEKVFAKRSNLNVHVRTAHEGRRFVCGKVDLSKEKQLGSWDGNEGCGKEFASKSNLVTHVRYIHLKMERPLNRRGKRGQTTPLDEISGASDAAKRNIKCPVNGCEFKFIRNHDLQKHMREYLHIASGSGGAQADQQTDDAGVDPSQTFVDSEAAHDDDASRRTLALLRHNPYTDFDFYPDMQDPQFSGDARPATEDAFSIELENAELAQQLVTADDMCATALDNIQRTLVQA